MRRVSVEQRRARLGVRHHLATAAVAGDVVEVARDLVGLHATDPKTVFLAARARMRDANVGAMERALYKGVARRCQSHPAFPHPLEQELTG